MEVPQMHLLLDYSMLTPTLVALSRSDTHAPAKAYTILVVPEGIDPSSIGYQPIALPLS